MVLSVACRHLHADSAVPAEDDDIAQLYGAMTGGGGAGSTSASVGRSTTDSYVDVHKLYNARSELTAYFAMTVPAGTAPLEFWDRAAIKERFPILSFMARKFLCVLAASTPSERLFSIGGELVCVQLSVWNAITSCLNTTPTINMQVPSWTSNTAA
jgi:hypothetical protein